MFSKRVLSIILSFILFFLSFSNNAKAVVEYNNKFISQEDFISLGIYHEDMYRSLYQRMFDMSTGKNIIDLDKYTKDFTKDIGVKGIDNYFLEQLSIFFERESLKDLSEYKKLKIKEIKTFFKNNKRMLSILLSIFIMIEHSGDSKSNPNNFQGVFQQYSIEKYSHKGGLMAQGGVFDIDTCKKSGLERTLYTTCEEISSIYKPNKKITEEELSYQIANILILIKSKIGAAKNRIYYGTDYYFKKPGVNLQSDIENFFGSVAGVSKEDLSFIIKSIDMGNLSTKDEYDIKYKQLFNKYQTAFISNSIMSYHEIQDVISFYVLGIIGASYNGWGNMGTHVLDNGYISNVPDFNMCFGVVKSDGGGISGIKKTNTLLANYTNIVDKTGRYLVDDKWNFLKKILELHYKNGLFKHKGDC